MTVTGLRVATELTLGTAMFGLLVAVVIWWRTGIFNLFPGTARLLEQLVFFGVMLSGLFAVIWLNSVATHRTARGYARTACGEHQHWVSLSHVESQRHC